MDEQNQSVSERVVFHFDIGDSRRRFTIHKALLSCVSGPLSALTSNGMRESQEGVAHLEGVEVETFSRFAEWLYTEAYSAPSPDESEEESDDQGSRRDDVCGSTAERQHDVLVPREASRCVSASIRDSLRSSLGSALEESKQGTLLPTTTSENSAGRFISSNLGKICAEQDRYFDGYGNALYLQCLCHAELYVFADQRQVYDLQTLVAERLRASLKHIKDYAKQAILVTSLIDYAYEYTASMNLEDNKLRRVVVEFAIEHLEDLMRTPVFMNTLGNGGQFVQDFVQMMAARTKQNREHIAALEDVANHWQVFIANASY
ncbi:hypothetical protein E4T39_08726 [Aureobasidium subglaciale]|nr:hypothetical protein E4T39_08726 [Aureobasidium subglaciale]